MRDQQTYINAINSTNEKFQDFFKEKGINFNELVKYGEPKNGAAYNAVGYSPGFYELPKEIQEYFLAILS